jgi:hypothetical protein
VDVGYRGMNTLNHVDERASCGSLKNCDYQYVYIYNFDDETTDMGLDTSTYSRLEDQLA